MCFTVSLVNFIAGESLIILIDRPRSENLISTFVIVERIVNNGQLLSAFPRKASIKSYQLCRFPRRNSCLGRSGQTANCWGLHAMRLRFFYHLS